MPSSLRIGHQVPSRSTSYSRHFLSFVTPDENDESSIKKIAIIGGGLSGLSTAFHLLEKSKTSANAVHVTVIDKAPVGTAGASSVAGGLVHPLSPRGKLVHWGLEGLACTNRLVELSSQYVPEAIIRDELYRIALTEANVEQLQQTAKEHPEFCEWMDGPELDALCNTQCLGGLRLTKPCRVIHVPSYLQGLWAACISMSVEGRGTAAEWIVETEASRLDYDDWQVRLKQYDTVILSAGSALWQDHILPEHNLPVDLIRGQSIELEVPSDFAKSQQQALLCGKYISPLLDDSKVLIGATHEYQVEPFTREQVASDLRKRSYELAPQLWDRGTIDKITSGYRVQSRRGALGRIPIVGRLTTSIHNDAWIFTGLSSRGLLYHGIYGDVISDAILKGDETNMLLKYPHLNWWRESNSKRS